jgi:hypothetical protein
MFVRLHLGFGCGGVYLSSQATQEAEIRRITVSGQPRPKKKKKNISRYTLNGKKPLVVCAYHPSYSRKHKTDDSPG